MKTAATLIFYLAQTFKGQKTLGEYSFNFR